MLKLRVVLQFREIAESAKSSKLKNADFFKNRC